MSKWIELIKAIYSYLHDDFFNHPENEHEVRVINALYEIKNSKEPTGVCRIDDFKSSGSITINKTDVELGQVVLDD